MNASLKPTQTTDFNEKKRYYSNEINLTSSIDDD